MRLAKAASAEELSRRNKNRAKTRAAHEAEIRAIVRDIKNLLNRIEDAVPLINLAITTSGASLSTTLPPTVSPSRLLQASTFLTAGDTQYSMNPNVPAQIGPAFTLSLYMLFAGHAYRAHEEEEGPRETTWKEVIHKARVRLLRVPLRSTYGSEQARHAKETRDYFTGKDSSLITGEGKMTEYAYHIEIIEDFDDDRVHSYEDGEPQPGPYGDVQLAGIREALPIHQVSKIFYADTGKILNIGNQDETNSPVLLLKRDINALPPRRMMEGQERQDEWYEDVEDIPPGNTPPSEQEDGDDDENDIDEQLRKESMAPSPSSPERSPELPQEVNSAWRLPQDLDREWLALEVYNEAEDSESEDEFELERMEDSAYPSSRPISSGGQVTTSDLTADLSKLKVSSTPATPISPAVPNDLQNSPIALSFNSAKPPINKASPFGPIRSSLSLLEMLIRLTALQQFQQASHLSIPDELLTFFLEESSTTGAGGDATERKRTRLQARRKVGFDPYDESPVKRHGEEYQYGGTDDRYSREGTPYEELPGSPRWASERGSTPQRDTVRMSREIPDSPVSPYRPVSRSQQRFQLRQVRGPMERLHTDKKRQSEVRASPLGRAIGEDIESPTLVVGEDLKGEGE
ncbi:Ran-specific GTPase-activating protein 30 [Clarireedia jacksonii]